MPTVPNRNPTQDAPLLKSINRSASPQNKFDEGFADDVFDDDVNKYSESINVDEFVDVDVQVEDEEAVPKMLNEIGTVENIPEFIGVMKNRAKVIRKLADEVFSIVGREPLIEVAVALEKAALSDQYFVKALSKCWG
ncbi:PREDICTED: citrate [Prunus dulcis]|uniref:PREDICTED: citrate n=1 Tax=Prunus dulcis TaxID=3755 RepID=A0A5E4ERY2_PRUDU|nr:PREDICTED: citrate [Prunus dulcis]